MKFITMEAFRRTLTALEFPHQLAFDPGLRNDSSLELTLTLPDYHARLVPMAKLLMELLGDGGSYLFAPLACGIWPSSEHWPLYDALRVACKGGDYSRANYPCLVATRAEIDALISFCTILMLFGCDFALVNVDKKSAFFSSHDAWIRVYDPQGMSRAIGLLEKSGLSANN